MPPVDSSPAATIRTAPASLERSFANGIRSRWWWLGLAAAMAAVVASLLWTGATAVSDLADPGSFTRWGLPVVTTIHNLALSTVIGSLVFAVVILPKDLKRRRPHSGNQKRDTAKRTPEPEHPAFTRALTLAMVGGGIWTMSAIAVLSVFTFLSFWNSYLWPLIVTVDLQSKGTLPVGLASFSGLTGTRWDLQMAAAIISMIPTTVLVIALQKHLVKGISMAGLGGR